MTDFQIIIIAILGGILGTLIWFVIALRIVVREYRARMQLLDDLKEFQAKVEKVEEAYKKQLVTQETVDRFKQAQKDMEKYASKFIYG